jgi:hypothetical protein
LLARAIAALRKSGYGGSLCGGEAFCTQRGDITAVYLDDVRSIYLQGKGGGIYTTFVVELRKGTRDVARVSSYRTRVDADGRYDTLPPEV